METIKPVTQATAEQCLAAVKLLFADVIAESAEEPKLYPPGFHDSGWTIAWEGRHEWTLFTLVDPNPRGWPEATIAEPVNGWCLGIYRDVWA